MVTDEALPRRTCKAAHLLGKKRVEMAHKFGLSDIFDEKNGLLWAEGIENAYGKNQVCLVHDFIHNKLHFKVLDPSLIRMTISPTNVKFSDVNGKALTIPPKDFPYRRLIWAQCNVAIEHAIANKWISDADLNFYQETLTIVREHLSILIENSCDSECAMEDYKERHAEEKDRDYMQQNLFDGLVRSQPNSSNPSISKDIQKSGGSGGGGGEGGDAQLGITRKCSICNEFKNMKYFSRNQWTKPLSKIKTMVCKGCQDKDMKRPLFRHNGTPTEEVFQRRRSGRTTENNKRTREAGLLKY
jgi:hypothetical protein